MFANTLAKNYVGSVCTKTKSPFATEPAAHERPFVSAIQSGSGSLRGMSRMRSCALGQDQNARDNEHRDDRTRDRAANV